MRKLIVILLMILTIFILGDIGLYIVAGLSILSLMIYAIGYYISIFVDRDI